MLLLLRSALVLNNCDGLSAPALDRVDPPAVVSNDDILFMAVELCG